MVITEKAMDGKCKSTEKNLLPEAVNVKYRQKEQDLLLWGAKEIKQM